MMSRLRSLNVFVSAGIIVTLLATGCGATASVSNQAAKTSTVPSQLIMATSADYPPYEFHDLSKGTDQIKGFDIDIAKQIAKDLGFKFTIKDITFDGLIGALQSKRADFVIAGMVPTAARKKNADFSEIYHEFKNSIVVKKGTGIKASSQLAGKKVAAQTGTTQELLAKKIQGATIISLDTIPTIVQEVESGRADGAIIADNVAAKYVQTNSNLAMYPMPASLASGQAIAFPKGSKLVGPFNKEIQKMKADGDLAALIKKWFGNSNAQ